jgi:hypothetical protein
MPVDEQTSRNNWPIISGKTGKVEKLREMLAQGADINAYDGYCTALMDAAMRVHLDYVAEIVRLGADLSRTSSDGKTAADFAAEASHRAIVDDLFAHGAHYGPLEEVRELRADESLNRWLGVTLRPARGGPGTPRGGRGRARRQRP